MNVLEALWDGGIRPSEREIRTGSEYARILNAITELQSKSFEALAPEVRESFENFTLLHGELCRISEQDSFIKGFRLGVQLFLSATGAYDSPLPQIGGDFV